MEVLQSLSVFANIIKETRYVIEMGHELEMAYKHIMKERNTNVEFIN